MTAERADSLRAWHEDASAELHELGSRDVVYLGLDLHVPAEVFGPTPVSDLLGREVIARTSPGARVLDMGSGAGANGLLAARAGADVTAVDVNPLAVRATYDNAERNGLAERVRVVEGDLFDRVEGRFDLVVFDPPFRWFRPRDLLERAITDEGYATLTRFVEELPTRLAPGGSALVFFGTSGDEGYLRELIGRVGLGCAVVAERSLEDGRATYHVFVLDRPPGEADR